MTRNRTIDIARCIGIFSIIIGHFGIYAIVRIVFTYHIPIFYLITGYFVKKENMVPLIKKKAKSLLVPYTITCCVVILLSCIYEVIKRGNVPAIFGLWFKASLYGAGGSYHLPAGFTGIGAIWFLWASFWGSIFLQKCLNWKIQYRLLWIGVLFAFGYITAHKTIWFPFSFQAGCCSTLYMYIGYCARRCDKELKAKLRRVSILAFMIWIAFIYYFDSFYLVQNDFGRGLPNIIASLCACYCIILISGWLDHLGGMIAGVMAFFGRNSLVMLCVHLTEMNLVDWWSVVGRFERLGLSHIAGCVCAVSIKLGIIIG